MTSPEPTDRQSEESTGETEVPPANPAYATPPPEGLPDADTETNT